MNGFNCIAYDGGVCGVLFADRLSLFELVKDEFVVVCVFSGLDNAQCFGLSGRVVAIFEEHTLMVYKRSSGVNWVALGRWNLTWLAHSCSIVATDDKIVVAGASISGVVVWTIDLGLKKLESRKRILPLHSIECVKISPTKGVMAVSTMDGHVGIDFDGEFVWFSEKCVTDLEFNESESLCVAVCWDGSGAVFEFCIDSKRWRLKREFQASLLFSAGSAASKSPALASFRRDDCVVVFCSGALKVVDDRRLNVRWIDRHAVFDGFCNVDGSIFVAWKRSDEDDGGKLVKIQA